MSDAALPITTTATSADTKITTRLKLDTSSGSSGGGGDFPYAAQPRLARLFFISALVIAFGQAIWEVLSAFRVPHVPELTVGGGAAALTAVLFAVGLLCQAPVLILDDSPQAGGEPSAMRILALAIVLIFCVLTLRTGWYHGTVPTISGEWIGILMAALGGKVAQSFVENRDQTQVKKP